MKITISINDQNIEVSPEDSLRQMIEAFGFHDLRGIALAENNQVIPRAEWETRKVSSGGNYLLITAAQGG